ncbi:MAG: Gfo/Idh/MocA family oxidoreductase [Bacteroidales bacterium]|nr:Gfo/Idh/MocA family oxidoreductase [Bacteroidales bacterium]MBN2820608.1 Gfo/Idh/MocA family oxidoreductase [Bacteroidales bacterium]
MKNFALVGVGGYIAVRHLKAIKETGNNLIASLDPNDSVGIIDSYFPDSPFFVEFERFDRHIEKLRRKKEDIDFVSICSPNYLHDAHIRFALRVGADAICEKPLVLNPWNVDALGEIERETGRKIYNILQLRLHPSIIELKRKIEEGPKDKIYDIDLSYITSRGKWYFISWKGDVHKSGGIATNIGVHFFDMLSWIFGPVKENIVHVMEPNKASGFLGLKRARVKWYLSLDYNDIPDDIRGKGQRTYRSITIDDKEIEFSGGFTDLHTKSYQDILDGKGFGIYDSKEAIDTVYNIRNNKPIGLKGEYHAMCKNIK